MRHGRSCRLERGGPLWARHSPYRAPAPSPVPSSPSQGSSLFPTGFSRSWTFRSVMPAPTAAWPPTPPTSASARRPCSVWPAEVRGLPVAGNQGVSGVSLERPQRSKPCLHRGDGVSLSSDRRGDEAQRSSAAQQVRERPGLDSQCRVPFPLGWLEHLGLGAGVGK